MKLRLPLTILIAAMVVFAGYAALFIAPDEATMHEIQRIFYFHVPSWSASFSAFFISFAASIAFLATRRELRVIEERDIAPGDHAEGDSHREVVEEKPLVAAPQRKERKADRLKRRAQQQCLFPSPQVREQP